jgi:hypothetical protein
MSSVASSVLGVEQCKMASSLPMPQIGPSDPRPWEEIGSDVKPKGRLRDRADEELEFRSGV